MTTFARSDIIDHAIKARLDIISVLETSPREVTGLLRLVESGEINGRLYEGECKCLLGTLTHLKLGDAALNKERRSYDKGDEVYKCMLQQISDTIRSVNSTSPAERWFTYIGQGDTPETNIHSRVAAQWIREWLDSKGMLK